MSFKESIEKVGVDESSIVDWREGKFYSSGEDSFGYKGYVILTKDRLIFVSKKGFLRSIQKKYDMPVTQIQKITKLPLMKRYTFFANTAEKDAGFLKKMFSTKNAEIDIQDGKTFIEKIRKINPGIE